jgi:hypothetical protein
LAALAAAVIALLGLVVLAAPAQQILVAAVPVALMAAAMAVLVSLLFQCQRHDIPAS